jgi:hypothetical protein
MKMQEKRLTLKNQKLRALLRRGGRKGARKDFFELLRRASRKSAAAG